MFAGKTLGIGGPHQYLVNQQMIKEDKDSEKSELRLSVLRWQNPRDLEHTWY